jgi:hypothetical protein
VSADQQKAVTGSADGKVYQCYAAYREAMRLVTDLHEAMEAPRLSKVTGNNAVHKPVAYDVLPKKAVVTRKELSAVKG